MIAPLKKNRYNNKIMMLGDIQGCGTTDFIYDKTLSQEETFEYINTIINKIGTDFYLNRINANSILNSFFKIHEEDLKPVKEEFTCVNLTFNNDIDSHIKNLSSSVRQNIRTAYNRMKRDGIEFEIKIWQSNEHLPKHIWNDITELYLNRLFGKYLKHRVANWLYKYYKTLSVKYIKHDTKSLNKLTNTFHATIYSKGVLMGFMSGFTNHSGTGIVIPRLAINDKFKFYSPGYVLICEIMKLLANNTNIREIDLSRGTERYKTDLGGKFYQTMSYSFKKNN